MIYLIALTLNVFTKILKLYVFIISKVSGCLLADSHLMGGADKKVSTLVPKINSLSNLKGYFVEFYARLISDERACYIAESINCAK